MKNKLKKIFNILSYVFMGIIIIFIIYAIATTSSGNEVSIFGYKVYVVKTDSMVPTIEVDTVILVHEEDYTDLNKGEVITFTFSKNTSIPNTHRIVGFYYEYTEDGEIKHDSTYDYNTISEFELANPNCNVVGYRTQGDNPECKLDIKPVTFDNIRGVYQSNLVVITFLYGLLTSFFGFLLIILIPLFILLIMQLVSMYKLHQQNKLDKELELKEKEQKELEEKIKEEAIKEYLKKQEEN